jgi:hypothetical protein
MTWLVGGCGYDYPEDWRASPRNVSVKEIAANWESVHRALSDGALRLHLGAEYEIRQELHPAIGQGSVYAWLPAEGRVSPFLIDVQPLDCNRARVTIYAATRFWQSKLAAWLDEIIALKFLAASTG